MSKPLRIETVTKIRRNADGAVTRVFETWEKINPTETESEIEERIIWMWSAGNWGCDCNRHNFFHDVFEDTPCSEGLYSVRVHRVDGVVKLLYAEYGPDVSNRYLEKEADKIKALKRGVTE